MGQTLTADTSGISDADGLTDVTYSCQWLADDTEIDGATSSRNSSRLRGRVGLQSKFRAWLPLCEKPDGP